MDSAKKVALWLLKKSYLLAAIAFVIMAICSYMWFKMGMSPTQTMLNYAVINANASVDVPTINEGDLIVAKEYLFKDNPEKHDVVVYLLDGKFDVSIVEKVTTDEDDTIKYRVTPSKGKKAIFLYKDDIVGELTFTAKGLGSFSLFAISPFFILVLCVLIGLLVKSIKSYLKDRNISNGAISVSYKTIEPINISEVDFIDKNVSSKTSPKHEDTTTTKNIIEVETIGNTEDVSTEDTDNEEKVSIEAVSKIENDTEVDKSVETVVTSSTIEVEEVGISEKLGDTVEVSDTEDVIEIELEVAPNIEDLVEEAPKTNETDEVNHDKEINITEDVTESENVAESEDIMEIKSDSENISESDTESNDDTDVNIKTEYVVIEDVAVKELPNAYESNKYSKKTKKSRNKKSKNNNKKSKKRKRKK